MPKKNKLDITVYPNHSIFIERDEIKIEKAENEFLQRLNNSGIQVNIAGFINDLSNTALQGVVGKGDFISIINLGKINNKAIFSKIICYVKSLKEVFSIVNKKTFNYVFFPGHVNYLVIIVALILKKPFGLYIRGVWSHNKYIDWLNILAFKRAKFIFTTGPAFKDEIGYYNLLVEEVVPMINLPEKFINSKIKNNKDSNSLVFIGRISKVKGLYDIVEALAILNHKEGNLTLDIVGGGTEQDLAELNAFIQVNKVERYINLHGHIAEPERLATILSNGWLFVFPTTFPEGFPRVIYEAMLLGVPVITTSMPGAKGFLVDDENCLITKPNNPEDLSLKIDKVLNNNDLYLKLKDNALSLVTNKFNNLKFDNHADQVVHELKRLSGNEYNS